MSNLHVGIVGFDITPPIDPVHGAWGTTPSMTEIDMPLLARCIALRQDERLLIWFGSDLIGEGLADTDTLRDAVAQRLDLDREQIIWSTSQTHSSAAIPGSDNTGAWCTDTIKPDAEALARGRKQFIDAYVDAASQALEQLQPANVWAGQGFCDSISYNSRFPMPTGGNKFSRNYAEGLQSGKYYDPTIGLIRFESRQGEPLGAIFNFNCHPAVLINDKYVSPDYVGTARQHVEEAIGGAPAMFVQGFCGDVHPRHMFGTCQDARRIGARLGQAAAEAMSTLIPARTTPFDWTFKTVPIPCQPMPSQAEIDAALAARRAYVAELEHDPQATWVDGYNLAEPLAPEMRVKIVETQLEYYDHLSAMLDRGEQPDSTMPITLGAVRIGDVGAALSPGENFAQTALQVRQRSPFAHTLICGDSNGLFSYIGNDEEIDRRGFETDIAWRWVSYDGVRLPPAKGATQRVVKTCVELLERLQAGH